VGTQVGNISCVDSDENHKIQYRLKHENGHSPFFGLNSETGQLTVIASLRGHGRSAPYLLTVIAEDGTERTVSLTIPVKVTNVIPNDGKPFFLNKNLTATVYEGATRGSKVFQAKAYDTDSYDNGEGRLFYTIMKQLYPCSEKRSNESVETFVQDVDYFTVDSQSGVVTLKDSIDREKHDCFSLLIGVHDGGVPAQMNSQWFDIFVDDMDDNLPFLLPSDRKLDLEINETTKIGTEVYMFHGHDNDLAPNNLITFEISGGGSDLFHVVQKGDQNASLILNADLMQLKQKELHLGIKCHPKHKKIVVPDCASNVNVKIVRHLKHAHSNAVAEKRTGVFENYEMLLGVAASTQVGNLIGNAGMKGDNPSDRIKTTVQMYHPNSVAESPYNVSGLLRIDECTGDIFVWDSLKSYGNGHLRMKMMMMPGADESKNVPSHTKGLKVFVLRNDQLLSADMYEYSKLDRWIEAVSSFMNSRKKNGVRRGLVKVLTFDQSSSTAGKTRY